MEKDKKYLTLLERSCVNKQLSSTAFKLLYFMVKKSKEENKENVKIYIKDLSTVLNLSDVQTRRLIKELEDCGYISKKINNGTIPNEFTIHYEN